MQFFIIVFYNAKSNMVHYVLTDKKFKWKLLFLSLKNILFMVYIQYIFLKRKNIIQYSLNLKKNKTLKFRKRVIYN